MTDRFSSQIKFGLFPNSERAAAACEAIDEVVDGEVELLTQAEDLTQDKIPLNLTMARIGTFVGASVVAGLMLAALAGLVLVGIDGLPTAGPAPYATVAVAVMLAAVLGGLAGSLSYATRAQVQLRRLRQLLRFGNSVVLVESERDLSELLRRRGAIQTGTLA